MLKLQVRHDYTPITWGGHAYYYNDWERYAKVDGWVCRNDLDCSWLDPNLGCNDREFKLSDIMVKSYTILNFDC